MWFIIFLSVLSLIIYLYGIKPYRYWEKKDVKSPKAAPFFGNIFYNIMQQENFNDTSQRIYNYAPNERYVGYYDFTSPTLLIRDPELIKQITVKDFDVFADHKQLVNDEADPLWSRNLFSMRGAHWRAMRPTLSPSFTSSKMRAMFSLMVDCSEQFVKYFQNEGDVLHTVEVKDIFTRFTNDVIATCAFGVQCDSLSNKTNDFYVKGKDASDFSGFRVLRFMGHQFTPFLMKLLDIGIFSKPTSTFFTNVILETIKLREEKGVIRPDMINLLMEARKGKLKQEEANIDTGFATVKESDYGKSNGNGNILTDEEIVAQALIFFIAGFDTASTLMCFLAYELAVNPDVQKKLLDEMDATLKECNGKVTYEALMGMKYLDMIVTETLRKWPPTASTDRTSNKPYTIPAKLPGEKPVYLPAGSSVNLPMFAIQRDPQYYPNPEKFDPERFSDENKHKVNPLTYFPFGAGPRNCIGSRFALLENKTIIFNILRQFEIVPVEKTHIPMVLSKKHFGVAPKDGLWLGLKPRKAN